jgi:ribosomal protein L37AE/L43A
MSYAGAGDGQCLGIQNDGERCTNGVYGTDDCCGTHKRASDVTLAPEKDDRDWFRCPECGWQQADYERGGGGPPYCSWCGVEFPADAEKFEDREVTLGA